MNKSIIFLFLFAFLFIKVKSQGCSGLGPDKWQDSYNQNHFFQRINSISWHEISNGQIISNFYCISDVSNNVFLFEYTKQIYVKLDSKSCQNKNRNEKIYFVVYFGEWVENHQTSTTTTTNSLFIQSQSQGCSGLDYKKWQDLFNPNHYFERKSSDVWLEISNGQLISNYFCLSDGSDNILLFN